MKSINKVEFEMRLKGMEESKAVVDEAVKIAKDYPMLNIREVIAKAKPEKIKVDKEVKDMDIKEIQEVAIMLDTFRRMVLGR